jgi:hypothetical protein
LRENRLSAPARARPGRGARRAARLYRGFKPKPAGIRIINFRVTTSRLQSKSNRCHGDAISQLSLCLYLPIEIPYEYLAGKLGTAVT